ncbi:PLP-dependent aminotransferase family protein [Pseudonocardia spinosispora]|uniref:aminotransferase-like domain-containing protein n=1 Tax=Pseudonocardia spinosispora TaxID=103441 RepID=UPI0003F53BA7|nr:PLP-dependent aminotransferase family protein [Pseudonocardia spinosispora]
MSDHPDARLVRLLGGWESADGPLPQRLHDALATLIDEGDLATGDRLPAERGLAAALLVSRGTVTEAYRMLQEGGRVSSRRGSGSVVTSQLRRGTASSGLFSTFASRRDEPVDLSSGAPGGLDLVVGAARRALAAPAFAQLVAGDGYDLRGLAGLRAGLGRYYDERGIPTSPDELLVTNGSQQAMKLLADTLVARDDYVLVEDPTYRGSLEVLRARNARIVPVPLERDGPDVEAMERLVRRLRPRLVYLLPLAHNPTGYVISEEKATRLARLFDETGTLLVEDGSPADLVFAERVPRSVGAHLTGSDWIAIGSISKLFWGGLRVGWIRARSPALLEALARAKAADDLGGALVSQVVAQECLTLLPEARELRRHALRRGLRTATEALAELAPEWTWQEPEGGAGLWVELPGTDAARFAQHSKRHGITIVAGPVFSAVSGFPHHIRLPFLREPDQLLPALEQLTGLWRSTRDRNGSSRA